MPDPSNCASLSDRTALRRYLAIVQDPRGYPAEGLEPAPPDGPGQPTLYTVVKADEHEAEVARLRAAISETLCDDEPCARCRHLREALNGGATDGR